MAKRAGQGLTVQVRPVPQPRPATPAFIGVIDGIFDGVLNGWGVTADGEPTDIHIFIDDREVDVVRSTVARDDLQANGVAKGLGGFQMEIAPLLGAGTHNVSARFADGTALMGELQGIDRSGQRKAYTGAIESQQVPLLRGWSLDENGQPVTVTLEMDDRAPLELPATEPRPDLVASGISKGEGGWSIDVIPLLVPGTNHIRLRFPNMVELPGSPITLHRPADGTAPAVKTLCSGHVDSRDLPELSGWSVDADRAPAPVYISINGASSIELKPDVLRESLVNAGLTTGPAGWRIDITKLVRPGLNRIHVRFPDGFDVPGSPFEIAHGTVEESPPQPPPPPAPVAAPAPPPPPAAKPEPVRYEGAIERQSAAALSGWATASGHATTAVQITINDIGPLKVTAGDARGDPADDHSGWHLDISGLAQTGENRIHVRFADGSDLPGSPFVVEKAPEPPRPMTLNELDELSMDDLVDVVASGLFDFSMPDQQDEPAPTPEKPEPEAAQHKPGVFSRFLARFRRG